MPCIRSIGPNWLAAKLFGNPSYSVALEFLGTLDTAPPTEYLRKKGACTASAAAPQA